MKKNDTVQLTITDYTQEGLGIGHAGGMAVFVKDTVIGDRVNALITKVKKTYAFGRLVEILAESPDRVHPPCPVAAPCGGCQIQMMSYPAQLRYKQEKVRNCLIRIGGFSDLNEPDMPGQPCSGKPSQVDTQDFGPVMEPILGMETPWRFRNKAQYPVGRDKNGKLTAGFYAGRTHSIIACGDCLIGIEENREILDAVLGYMDENQIEPYNETSQTGLIRHVMIRKGFATGQIMVVLVINGTCLPYAERLTEKLAALPCGLPTCLAVNRNERNTNVILGDETVILSGLPYIEDMLGDIRFRIGVRSFYQVNPVQTQKLYQTALEYAQLTGTETVWDLYCGIGTISLFLARRAAHVYGVEIIPEAIENARENARINGITNVDFFTGKTEEILPAQYEKTHIHADVIVVDPPRKGCEKAVLETMLALNPGRIVYVSCDPATLARDLKYLCTDAYQLQRIRPVDQFSHSTHCEVVVAMSRAGLRL